MAKHVIVTVVPPYIVAEPKGEASNRGARVAVSLYVCMYTVQVAIYHGNVK